MNKPRILLVDDEAIIQMTVSQELQDAGYEVATASSGEQAIDKITNADFDLVITDLVMEGIDGMDVLKAVKKKNPDIPVMVMTGYGSSSTALEVLNLGASDYLTKPCEHIELLMRIRQSLENLSFRRQEKEYVARLENANSQLVKMTAERERAEETLRHFATEVKHSHAALDAAASATSGELQKTLREITTTLQRLIKP